MNFLIFQNNKIYIVGYENLMQILLKRYVEAIK